MATNLGRKNYGLKSEFVRKDDLADVPPGILSKIRSPDGRALTAFPSSEGVELVLGVPKPNSIVSGGGADERLYGCGGKTVMDLLIKEAERNEIRPCDIHWYILRTK